MNTDKHRKEFQKLIENPKDELEKKLRKRAFTFIFFKRWQRLVAYTIAIFLIKMTQFSMGVPEIGFPLIMSIFALGYLAFIFKNKKIIMTEDYLYMENFVFGFKSKYFHWREVTMSKNKFLIFTILKLNIGEEVFYIFPAVWGNSQNRSLEGVLSYYLYEHVL